MKNAEKTFVFVNLSVNGSYYGVHHGIAYLVPIVRRNSFKVAYIDIIKNISSEEFRRQIESLNPSIIGYSFTSPQIRYLIKYSKAIETLSDILQIAGGVGSTLNPEGVLSQTSVDGFVIGEGEIPLDSLLKTINEGGDIHCVKGIAWCIAGEIKRNVIPQYIFDLCQLDFPDYSVFDKDVVVSDSMLFLMLSRGCPYNCTYCSNKAIRSIYPSQKSYFRVPSVEHSIKLVEKVIRQYPETKQICFEDDLLISKQEWFFSFAKEYQRRIGIPYRMNVRIECINEDIVRGLKESGCVVAFLGLESGNENFRKKILNRHHSNQEIIEKTKMIKKANIKLFTYNMVGFPFETKQHLRDTLKLNKRIKPDSGVCTFFYPFLGTELYKICKKEGLLNKERENEMPTNYNTKPIIPPTRQQKRESIKAQKKITNYLSWQNLRYEQKRLRSIHSGLVRVAYYLIRSWMIYLLLTRYKKEWLYWWFVNNKLLKRISALLRDE